MPSVNQLNRKSQNTDANVSLLILSLCSLKQVNPRRYKILRRENQRQKEGMGRVSRTRSTRTSYYGTIHLCAHRVGHQGGRLAKRTWMRRRRLEQQEREAEKRKEERVWKERRK